MRRKTVAPLILLSALLVSACDHRSPTAPSTPASSPSPAATVTEAWNVTARLTSVSGGECVGEKMQSQIGVPKSYSLSTTRTGSNVDAMLRSTAGDYACTFTGGQGDTNGFTFGQTGYFSCEAGGLVRGVLCLSTGVQRDMEALGQTLSGRVSGNTISGTWHVSWVVYRPGEPFVGDIATLETTTEYTGSR
jgi:hypothetical protein